VNNGLGHCHDGASTSSDPVSFAKLYHKEDGEPLDKTAC